MKFNSEEERMAAYDAIPEDAPPGVKVEEWREEMEAKLNEIDEAEIDENYQPEEKPDEQTPTETPDPRGIEEPPASEEKPPEEKQELSPEEIRVRDMREEREQMMAKFEQERQEMASKIKSLEEKVAEPPQEKPATEPKPDPKLDENDRQIKNIQDQIEELEKTMNEVDDPYDQEYLKAMRKTSKLTLRLNNLMTERHSIELAKYTQEVEDLKKAQAEERERLAKEQENKEKQTAEQESRKKQIEAMETFRKSAKEFVADKPFEDMEADYADFAVNCAVAYTGKLPNEVTSQDTEIAVQKYLKSTPSLLEKLREKGVQEPKEMREFLIMSDVSALKMGLKLDTTTGKWVEVRDDSGQKINFPSLKAAYNYYKEEKGITGQELIERERKAAENVVKAIQTRADPKELDEIHRGSGAEEMTQDMALKIIDEWDEYEIIEAARNNIDSAKVRTYNKALMALGQEPIEEGF